ncbi:MAG TPA: inositol monophosphatase family protein [Anaerolineales bacterium]|nr:inositol monophosphatase family protein [Anaerolineales bacterium]
MEILEWTKNIALQAGDELLSWYGRTQVELKADGSLVTQADRAVDRLLTREIQAHFPQDAILSEEQTTTFTRQAAQANALWVIDPLDGTTNFAHGLHFWGVSIARLEQGVPTLAVLYWPQVQELYWAERGHGAWLNGQPIHTRPQPLTGESFLMQCTRTQKNYQVNVPCKRRIFGACAYHLCAVARGLVVGTIEAVPHLWDIAAGWLLIQEAGGEIATLAGGTPFPPVADTDYNALAIPTLAAANSVVWQALRAQIQ